jgi:agmatine deiminase
VGGGCPRSRGVRAGPHGADPIAAASARNWLGADVEVLETPLDDAWVRDIGPTFVIGPDGLGAVDWAFNGWGAQSWARWEHDSQVALRVAEWAGATVVPSDLVNEGGGIHVDGQGVVLATTTVQLDPARNPGWSHAHVEEELRRTIGITRAIWLPRGLSRDDDDFGTRGHVDIVATMPRPGTLLLHRHPDPRHPDQAVTDALRSAIPDDITVIEIPAPEVLTDEEGPVDYSYLNHYACNGAVIAWTFDDPRDAPALEVLAAAYPGRQSRGHRRASPLRARRWHPLHHPAGAPTALPRMTPLRTPPRRSWDERAPGTRSKIASPEACPGGEVLEAPDPVNFNPRTCSRRPLAG